MERDDADGMDAMLDERGLDVDGVVAGRLVVMWAMSHDAILCMERLLERGLNPDTGNYGSSLLLCAASVGSHAVMSLLLDHGADPNNTMWMGLSPLHCAVMRCPEEKALEMSVLLLGAGADPTLPDNDGLSPLAQAASRWTPESFRMLVSHLPDRSIM